MALTTPRKPTVHHKKASGSHHRHSKHYLKTYSPFLPLLLAVVIGLAINSLWSSREYHVLGAATNVTANELIQATNVERSRQQQADLAVDKKLTTAAQAKANDMVQRDYWSHNSPDGSTPWTFLAEAGYEYQSAGENLAYGFMNPGQILNGWMNSPEHRANILNANYQEIGIGITTAHNFQGKGPVTIVVALYGQPVSPDISVTGFVKPTAANSSSAVGGASTTLPSRNVSRISALTGAAAPWSFTIVTALTVLALAVIVFRHAIAWHRVLVRSEAFVLQHRTLDFVVLVLVLVGLLLTRSAGIIG